MGFEELAAGISLVATDLDGTLLRPDLTVSPYTVDVLARARAVGLPVVFATGRPPRWMPDVVTVTGHSGTGICANGAVVIDLASGDVLAASPIPTDVAAEVVSILRAEVPGITFAIEWVGGEGTAFAHEHSYPARYPVPDDALLADVLDLVPDRDVVKLLARLAPGTHDADAFLDTALAHVEHLVTATHSNAADVLVEMSAAGVSKGSAVAAHAAALGLEARAVAAVGDMPNDLSMIDWAGVGLGVAGGHPRVLATADAVVPDPSQDGVARFVDAVLAARPA